MSSSEISDAMRNTRFFVPNKNMITPSKMLYELRAGYKGSQREISPVMRILLNEIYLKGMEVAAPKVFYRTFDKPFLNRIKLPDSFQNLKEISVFISTLGVFLDESIELYLEKKLILKATLLDSWGSEALEALNERFDGFLREGREGTRRFSPGYSDVGILENCNLLELLEVSEVSCNLSTGILNPRKSTVCFIGWY